MLLRLRDMLWVYFHLGKRGWAFRRWQSSHPGGNYGQFYADDARGRINQIGLKPVILPKTLGRHIGPARARQRGESLLEYLKWAGCRPEHAVVDFGCGSLWAGEVLMSYLEPGRYIGMDVVDFFYHEALQRLGAEFVADRRPVLELISPASLEGVKARKADFIVSTAVLLHVRPADLSDYFTQLTSLCGPSTRIIIGHKPHRWTRVDGAQSLQHSRRSIEAALADIGYEPHFEKPPGAPRCQVALFEIAPIRRA